MVVFKYLNVEPLPASFVCRQTQLVLYRRTNSFSSVCSTADAAKWQIIFNILFVTFLFKRSLDVNMVHIAYIQLMSYC